MSLQDYIGVQALDLVALEEGMTFLSIFNLLF